MTQSKRNMTILQCVVLVILSIVGGSIGQDDTPGLPFESVTSDPNIGLPCDQVDVTRLEGPCPRFPYVCDEDLNYVVYPYCVLSFIAKDRDNICAADGTYVIVLNDDNESVKCDCEISKSTGQNPTYERRTTCVPKPPPPTSSPTSSPTESSTGNQLFNKSWNLVFAMVALVM